MYKFHTAFYFFILLISFSSIASALEQYVRDTAFCREVVKNECIGAIRNGASISLSSLKIIDGNKRIYFWGNLRNPSGKAVAFYFSRQGDCYPDREIDPGDRALQELTFTDNITAFLTSVTIREVWHTLGFKSGKVGAKDVTVNVVLIPETNQFRINHYRYALCPGKFSARLVDSEGNPIPGNNNVKIILTD